jgi:hypothetical protein
MIASSLLQFLTPKFALSSFLILSKQLIGLITQLFSGQPKYRRSRRHLSIGGGFNLFGAVKLVGHIKWSSAAQADYQPRRRIHH